jgi:hypothetical protein
LAFFESRSSEFSVVGSEPLFYHRKTRKILGGRWLGEAESGRFPPENGLLSLGTRGFGGSGSGVNNWAKT